MLTPEDLIRLPYTPDLTEAGITYACRSLQHTYDRMGGSLFKRLRRIVSGKAVELAFRRYLVTQDIPHDNLGATPFTDPDRYDVAIGGRRCDLKSYHFFRKTRIRRLRRDPGYLLQASALVPRDQMESGHLRDEDLYIFAFLSALIATQRQMSARAVAADQPIYLIHPMPQSWGQRSPWTSLGKLVLKTALSDTITLEIGGQGPQREFQSERLSLPPRRRTLAGSDFYTLSYLHAPRLPDGQVGIYSPSLKKTYVIPSNGWENIWVYGMDVILAGYMTRGEFRRRAQLLPAGSHVFQYSYTRTENYALPLSELYPLGSLFAQAKKWGRRQV